VRDAIDLLIDSKAGSVSFGRLQSDSPNLLLEAIFVLETVADPRWHVDQFLAPTPVRVVVDLRGGDATEEWPAATLASEVTDAPIERFLERPEFGSEILKALLDRATESAESASLAHKTAAQGKAGALLSAECQRLVDLRKVNDHVRPDEIAFAREQRDRIQAAIGQARLRLDAVRLVEQIGRATARGLRR
jgi:ATP-dependent helicase HepA